MAAAPRVDLDALLQVRSAALAVTRAVGTSTPQSLAELALARLLDLVPADRATFFVIDPLTDEAVRLAWREREPPPAARFASGNGAVGWSVANREPLLLSDARRDPRYQPIRSPVTRSLLTVPLEWEGRVIGALCCSCFAADALSATHLELTRLFGEHVAAAFALTRRSPGDMELDPSMVPARVLSEYAHDLRGPLHTALGYLALALQDGVPNRTESIAQAKLACQQALELSDAVLDSALEERQGLASVPVSRPTDLTEVLRTSAARTQSAAALREVRLETAIDSSSCLVAGPAKALERLLDNLILNAIAHSPQGGTIHAHLAAQGDRAVLSVEDQGPGIPEADLEKIFAPFTRRSGVRRDRGGLGLTLALRWATQRGGRLWAENRAGGGARFVLHLPLLRSGSVAAISSRQNVADDE